MFRAHLLGEGGRTVKASVQKKSPETAPLLWELLELRSVWSGYIVADAVWFQFENNF
jgi:hypothetical protein